MFWSFFLKYVYIVFINFISVLVLVIIVHEVLFEFNENGKCFFNGFRFTFSYNNNPDWQRDLVNLIKLVQREVSDFLHYTFLNNFNGFVQATWGFQASDMFAIVYCLSPFLSLAFLCTIDRTNLWWKSEVSTSVSAGFVYIRLCSHLSN